MGSVYAADMDQEPAIHQMQHHNFLSKRPYAKAPLAKQEADEKWVGAGLVIDQPEKGLDKHQQMQMHFISKRPYIAPMPD